MQAGNSVCNTVLLFFQLHLVPLHKYCAGIQNRAEVMRPCDDAVARFRGIRKHCSTTTLDWGARTSCFEAYHSSALLATDHLRWPRTPTPHLLI